MPEKTRINHFLVIIIFIVFILIGSVALFTLIKFSSQIPLIRIALYILLSILIGVPLIGSLFKIAYVSPIYDFYSGAGAGRGGAIEFLRMGKTSSRFFGMKNYVIPNDNIAYIIKTKFLILNKYQIFYYREKSLAYAKATILFWNLEKAISHERVAILPGLLSALWTAYLAMGLLIQIGSKKRLNTIKYMQSIYFGKASDNSKEGLSDKEYSLKGGGYICDFRYASNIAEMIKQQGYFGADPLQLLRLSLSNYATWPMVKLKLSSNSIQVYFAGSVFNIPWQNLKEVVVNKNMLGYTLTLIHNFPSAPQGIVYSPMKGDVQGLLNQIKKFTTVTYSEKILKTGARGLPKRNRWRIILILAIIFIIILPLLGMFIVRQIATSPDLQDTISQTLGPSETEKFLIYEDLNERIRIKYPKNWLKQGEGKKVTFYSPQEGKNDPYIEHVAVIIWNYDETISIKDVDNQFFETINTFPSSSVVIKGEDMLSSYPANYVVFTATDDLGFKKKLKWVWTVKDNKPYVIQFSAEPDKYDNHLETVNEMIDSFEII